MHERCTDEKSNAPDEIRRRVDAINVWKRGDQHAPHKPLLLLLALAKLSRGEPRLIPYVEIDPKLTELLREFGPVRKAYLCCRFTDIRGR